MALNLNTTSTTTTIVEKEEWEELHLYLTLPNRLGIFPYLLPEILLGLVPFLGFSCISDLLQRKHTIWLTSRSADFNFKYWNIFENYVTLENTHFPAFRNFPDNAKQKVYYNI